MRSLTISIQGSPDKPNQDSVGRFENESCCLFIVADGLGSCPRSDIGSVLICEEIGKTFLGNKELTMETVLGTVEDWKQRIQTLGYDVDDCLTTMSVLIVNENERWFTTYQVGDSTIFLVTDDEAHKIQDGKEFSNITHAVGEENPPIHTIKGKFHTFLGFMMGSDGIMDELDLSNGKELLDYILETCLSDTDLESEISNANFHNKDDKSIIIGWNIQS